MEKSCRPKVTWHVIAIHVTRHVTAWHVLSRALVDCHTDFFLQTKWFRHSPTLDVVHLWAICCPKYVPLCSFHINNFWHLFDCDMTGESLWEYFFDFPEIKLFNDSPSKIVQSQQRMSPVTFAIAHTRTHSHTLVHFDALSLTSLPLFYCLAPLTVGEEDACRAFVLIGNVFGFREQSKSWKEAER